VIKAGSLRPGTNASGKLSLIRQQIGDSHAKQASKQYVHKEHFWGFGTARAARVRPHGESLENHPDPFDGHVNLELGYPTPALTPDMPMEMTAAYAAAIDKLQKLSAEYVVIADPDPHSVDWTGPSLQAA